jgi:TPR repeat protein
VVHDPPPFPLSVPPPPSIINALAGLPKAEYAVGYFTEMGIGCRRDPLEANVWYVKAADQGDERAKHRIAAIRAAASGGPVDPKRGGAVAPGDAEAEKRNKLKRWVIF